MKKITLLLSFIACVGFTQAQNLLVEDFNYAVGQELIPNGWLNTGTAATPNILVTASTITYPGYPGSGIGNEITMAAGQDVNKTFTPQTSGNVFVSFIASITTATATGDYFVNLGAQTIGTAYFGRVFAKKAADSDKIAFGIQYTSGGTVTQTYSDFIYDLNTTYLIVLKYVIDGDNSNSSLIINPGMGSTEPTTGWLTNNSGTSTKPANIGAIALRQGSPSSAPTLKLDGIRVAKSWGDLFVSASVSTAKQNLKLFAANGKINFEAAKGETVEVYNTVGQKVLSAAAISGNNTLTVNAKGVVLVKVGNRTGKVIL